MFRHIYLFPIQKFCRRDAKIQWDVLVCKEGTLRGRVAGPSSCGLPRCGCGEACLTVPSPIDSRLRRNGRRSLRYHKQHIMVSLKLTALRGGKAALSPYSAPYRSRFFNCCSLNRAPNQMDLKSMVSYFARCTGGRSRSDEDFLLGQSSMLLLRPLQRSNHRAASFVSSKKPLLPSRKPLDSL